MTRIAIQDFSLANPLYIGKTLSFYTVDANGAKTSTLATLYAGPTGTDLLENPQDLDSEGKTRTPVYIEDPVIGVVTGLSAGDTETGIIPITGRNRGAWQAGTVYYPTEIFQNKEGGDKDGNWYISSKTHTAGVFDDDLGNDLFFLMLDVHQIANDFVVPPVQALTDQAQTYRDEAQTAAQNTFSTFIYTATGGETSLSGPDDNANTLAYVPGVIIVEMNGAILEDGVDFTATTGASITDLAALTAGDVVTIRAFGSFDVTDHETKTSGAHGVVGEFVGTLNTQTLLNKTLEDIVLTGDVSVQGGSGNTNNKIEISYNGSTGIAQIGPNSTGGSTSLKLGTSNAGVYADHLQISNSGSVGIGTSPSRLLHVKNSAVGGTYSRLEANGAHPAVLELNSGHGNWRIGNSINFADTLEFNDTDTNTSHLYINSTGNIGLGANPLTDYRVTSYGASNLSGCYTQIDGAGFYGATVKATNAAYAFNMNQWITNRAASVDFNYLVCESSDGADTDAKIDGTGAFYSDPGTYATGADYAEYFEWADGNPSSEDRRGWSVVLENGKIRKAVATEIPFGVISCNPSVVGDAAWNRWTEKYLKDDFNEYILEDYEVVEWVETKVVQEATEAVYQTVTKEREVQATETVTEDISSIEMIDGKYTKVVKTETKEVPLFDEFDLYEDGQVIGVHRVPRMVTETYDIEEIVSPAQDEKTEDVQHSYAVDQVPDGVVVPVDATRTTQQRRKLNPDFDENQEYIPRSERPEWDCVGLVGKLRLVKGEVVNPNWIKMRDISSTVEEWLVR